MCTVRVGIDHYNTEDDIVHVLEKLFTGMTIYNTIFLWTINRDHLLEELFHKQGDL